MKKKDNGSKTFKFIMILLFIAFMTLYISQATGYYDYEQHRKMNITAEKIKQFEQDVKDGKNIDIKNYLDNTTNNYNNGVSQTSLKLSQVVKKYMQKSISGVFSFLEKLLTS